MQKLLEQYRQKLYAFLERLRDIKFAGIVLFLIIVLLISWSGVKSIQSNYDLQKTISSLQQQNGVQKLENTNLQLENQYYNTDTYLDLAARQYFGLAAPGEKEILVPKNTALSYTVPLPKREKPSDTPSSKQPTYQRNFEAWVNFFMHRQNNI